MNTEPHDLDAEANVLGSILLDNAVHAALNGSVWSGQFFNESNRLIFAVIESLLNQGIPADLVTVAAELRNRKQLEAAGGMLYLAGLPDLVAASQYVAYYAKIVTEKSFLRVLERQARRLLRSVENGETGATESIFEELVTLRNPKKSDSKTLKMFTGSNAPTVKPVPWLVPGFLARGAGTILFGQPGVGKTTHGAALTASLVMGEDFGPFQVLKACRVLYVDFDGGWDWNANLFYAAFRALGLEGLPDEFAYFSPLTEACRDPHSTGLVNLEKIGEQIAQAVLEHGADVVVLDSLGQSMSGDPNSGQDVALALRLGLNPAREAGAAVLVFDHATKAARTAGAGVPTPAGSQQKRAWARVTVALEDEDGQGVRWSIDKTNALPWKPFLTRLEFVSSGDRLDTMTLEFEGEAGERNQPEKAGGEFAAAKTILEALATGSKKRGELPNNGTVQRALKQLIEVGEVVQLARGVYALPDQLPEPTPEIAPDSDPGFDPDTGIQDVSPNSNHQTIPLGFGVVVRSEETSNQNSNHVLTTLTKLEETHATQHETIAPTRTTPAKVRI